MKPESLSDDQLLEEATRLAATERTATARLIAALAEIDARRLYLAQGCPSLFVYCTRVLRMSEHAAYGRIAAARASRRFPAIVAMLERGELTLTSVTLLAPHLTDANHHDVLVRASRRSKREVEEIVAALRPRPDVPAVVRKLPDRREMLPVASTTTPERDRFGLPVADAKSAVIQSAPATVTIPAIAVPSSVTSSSPRATIAPLSPERYKFQVTVCRATQEKLHKARALMRHTVPTGDFATILDRALDLLLAQLERQKTGAAIRSRGARECAAGSRHIPAAVRRAVWARDGGRCAFVGSGTRCLESAFLEFHHVRPFAHGGEATVENIELRCRAHNQFEAHLFFGGAGVVREARAMYGSTGVRGWPSVRREFRGIRRPMVTSAPTRRRTHIGSDQKRP